MGILGMGIVDRINELSKRIKAGSGDNPLVFLDTGAVIDFENELKLWKQKDSSLSSSKWYSQFAKDFPIFVTEGVMEETTRHHEHNRVNGRPEISRETHAIMQKYHENYCMYLKKIERHGKPFDQVRLDAHWASQFAFAGDYKKGVLDVISTVDRETVETAVWLRYSVDSDKKPVTSSVILSPDRHLEDTVAVLTDRNMAVSSVHGDFGYDGIKVLTSRY